jgi:hypothetical protein
MLQPCIPVRELRARARVCNMHSTLANRAGECNCCSCMESARRGPRCARRLHAELCSRAGLDPDLVEPSTHDLKILVLKGGADLWMRRFKMDETLVASFDNDFWGFPDLPMSGETELTTPCCAQTAQPRVGPPSHTLYQRPADQLATEWSGPGSACAQHDEASP